MEVLSFFIVCERKAYAILIENTVREEEGRL